MQNYQPMIYLVSLRPWGQVDGAAYLAAVTVVLQVCTLDACVLLMMTIMLAR